MIEMPRPRASSVIARTIFELSPLSVDVLDEAAIDLQPVDLVRIDVAERGIAGAEIVELEMDAGGADVAQLGGDARSSRRRG